MHLQQQQRSAVMQCQQRQCGATHLLARPHVMQRRSAASVKASAAPAAAATAAPAALPTDVGSMTAQAAAAIAAAEADGVRRHNVTLINPVNEKAVRFTSTEAMDYPTSNMTEFKTLVNVTKDVLCALLPALGAPPAAAADLSVRRIDEGGLDGDLCAVVSAPGKRAVAVVWPTAEKLPLLKKLAADPQVGTLIAVNPLWKTEGNLVSEFGVLPWDRKANEEFVATLAPSYALYEQRIGAPSSVNLARGTRYETGAVVRVLRAHPGAYTVHVMAADGASQPIGGFDGKPSYKQLDALIAEARKAKLEIFELARAASSLDLEASRARGDSVPSNDGGADGGADSASAGGSFPTRAEVEAMAAADPKAVRRLLVSLGLPGSGTPAKLTARALAVADALAGGAGWDDALAAAKRLR